jgi:hypothetical protein
VERKEANRSTSKEKQVRSGKKRSESFHFSEKTNEKWKEKK